MPDWSLTGGLTLGDLETRLKASSETAAAVRDFACDVLGFGRLIAIINPANGPSRRVAEKIGMTIDKDAAAPVGTDAVIYAAHRRASRPSGTKD